MPATTCMAAANCSGWWTGCASTTGFIPPATWDTISPNIIDRIEVLYGGEGLFYGTEAASGVINIITKPVTKELSGQFKAAYGQYERRNLAGYVSQTIDKNGFHGLGVQRRLERLSVFQRRNPEPGG